MPALRKITIRIRRGGGFDVISEGKCLDRLNYDEMLGTVVSLAHPKLGTWTYGGGLTGKQMIERRRFWRKRRTRS